MYGKNKKNRALALIYHDVVQPEAHHLSGFPGSDAAAYKLDPLLFKRHIFELAREGMSPPVLVNRLFQQNVEDSATPWMMTFDDGGESFHSLIADLLEEQGWRGHFFVATDFIGKPGFMSVQQVRDLHRRGHLIGSHSCSHPLRFASHSREVMTREWSESIRILSDMLGQPVRFASLPGGQFSNEVAETAAAAGVEALFTSEPTDSISQVGGCLVIGRYSIQRWTPPELAAAIARGRVLPRYRQWIWWEFKKMSKALGGNLYLGIREKLMDRINPRSSGVSGS